MRELLEVDKIGVKVEVNVKGMYFIKEKFRVLYWKCRKGIWGRRNLFKVLFCDNLNLFETRVWIDVVKSRYF